MCLPILKTGRAVWLSFILQSEAGLFSVGPTSKRLTWFAVCFCSNDFEKQGVIGQNHWNPTLILITYVLIHHLHGHSWHGLSFRFFQDEEAKVTSRSRLKTSCSVLGVLTVVEDIWMHSEGVFSPESPAGAGLRCFLWKYSAPCRFAIICMVPCRKRNCEGGQVCLPYPLLSEPQPLPPLQGTLAFCGWHPDCQVLPKSFCLKGKVLTWGPYPFGLKVPPSLLHLSPHSPEKGHEPRLYLRPLSCRASAPSRREKVGLGSKWD